MFLVLTYYTPIDVQWAYLPLELVPKKHPFAHGVMDIGIFSVNVYILILIQDQAPVSTFDGSKMILL